MNLQDRSLRSFRAAGSGDGPFSPSSSSSLSSSSTTTNQILIIDSSISGHQRQQQQHQHQLQAPGRHAPQQHGQQQQQQQQQLSLEERNQIIFRKVRGILNKLTPEKFDKLGDQLIGLGLDSVAVLKGVILLIFEKAIEEPKYSSMYAQLCKKLSRELHNFEPQEQQQQQQGQGNSDNNNTTTTNTSGTKGGSNGATTTTTAVGGGSNDANIFCKLLLIKCRDEFDNRLKATEKFQNKSSSSSPPADQSSPTSSITSSSSNPTTVNNVYNNNKNGSSNNITANHNSANISSNHVSGAAVGSSSSSSSVRPVLTNLSSSSSTSGSGMRRLGGPLGQGKSQQQQQQQQKTQQQGTSSGSTSASAIANRKASEEEEEQMSIAKSKMLGNIRFICELGRQGLVQENILHLCIKQLVSKRKDETISSKSEDLECLCQIMKTVGKLLDTDKARKLMDQYFERIVFYSGCQELPSRIRFMLKDVIELRDGRWQPRRVQRENGPKPIAVIREEAARDLGLSPYNFWDMASILQNVAAAAAAGIVPPGAGAGRGPGTGPPFGDVFSFPNHHNQHQHLLFNQQQHQHLPLYGHPALPLVGGNPGQRALDDMGYYANFPAPNPFLGTGPGAIRELDRHSGSGGGGGNRNNNINRNQQMQQNMENQIHGRNQQQHQFSSSHQQLQQQQHLQNYPPIGGSNGGSSGGGGSSGHVQGHMPYRGSSSQDDPRNKNKMSESGSHLSQPNMMMSGSNNMRNMSRNMNQSSGSSMMHPSSRMMSQGGQILSQQQQQQQQQAKYPNSGPMSGFGMNQMPTGNPNSGGMNRSNLITTSQLPLLKNNSSQSIDKISLRPAHNSMVSKPMLSAANQSVNGVRGDGTRAGNDAATAATTTQSSSSVSTTGSAAAAPAVVASSAVSTPTVNVKELLLKKSEEGLDELLSGSCDMKDFMNRLKELKSQKNLQSDIMIHLIKCSCLPSRSDSDREKLAKVLHCMRSENLLTAAAFSKSCSTIMQSEMQKLEVDDPLIKTHVSEFVASFVCNKILTLKDAFTLVSDKYPMFLLLLQHMANNRDMNKQSICDLLSESKINLMSILPESDRNREQLNDILEKRGLSFLQPLLKIELDLKKLLKSNKDDITNCPSNLHKWIKDNVSDSLSSSKGFIHILYTCICRQIINSAERESNGNVKMQSELEKEYIKLFQSLLTTYTANRASLQLAAVYALQTVCHELSFPKGLILRWFNNLYDQEIIDEDIFLAWKEDINDEFPGKTKALFQVNAWLIWLAETEAESEDDDEDQDAE